MSTPYPDTHSSHSTPPVAASDSEASADKANPLWLLVAASAVFFAIAAGLLVSA
jgi:hypothetical protein